VVATSANAAGSECLKCLLVHDVRAGSPVLSFADVSTCSSASPSAGSSAWPQAPAERAGGGLGLALATRPAPGAAPVADHVAGCTLGDAAFGSEESAPHTWLMQVRIELLAGRLEPLDAVLL